MQHISAVGVQSAGAQWAGSVNGLKYGRACPKGFWITGGPYCSTRAWAPETPTARATAAAKIVRLTPIAGDIGQSPGGD